MSNNDPYLIIKNDGPCNCRGVFARTDIPPNTLIHVAPCIQIPIQEYEQYGKHTFLAHYVFNCGSDYKLLALGYGSLFNHSSERPNVDYRIHADQLEIYYYSSSYIEIKEGDELLIYYGSNIWFDNSNNNKKEQESDSSSDDQSFLGRIEL